MGPMPTFLLCFLWLQQPSDPTSEKTTAPSVQETLVVSASRTEEKRLTAPATVEAVTPDHLASDPTTHWLGSLAYLKGIDIAQGGPTTHYISLRGFADSFRTRVLSMVDWRLATAPSTHKAFGETAPNLVSDIKTLEVLAGPASAMYGPNAGLGVINVLTYDPWEKSGVDLEIAGGNRSYYQGNLRAAGVAAQGRFGWKVTGQLLEGREYETPNQYLFNGQNQTSISEQELAAFEAQGLVFPEEDLVDDDIRFKSGEVTLYYKTPQLTVTGLYGWSESTRLISPSLRGVNSELAYGQVRMSGKQWFFQYSRTTTDSGESYSMQNMPQFLLQGANQDQARQAARVIDQSSFEDADLQWRTQKHNWSLITGFNYRRIEPDSQGTTFNDFRDENGRLLNDISFDQTGLYAQVDGRFNDAWRLNAAVRYDESDNFESNFSPKLALTYQHGIHHFRGNWLVGHKDPTPLETNLFFLGGVFRGNQDGFQLVTPTGDLLQTIAPLEPEEVQTFELGYHGLINASTHVEVTVHQSTYDNFISSAIQISNPEAGVFGATNEGELIPLLITYLNYGKADSRGVDAGVYTNLPYRIELGFQASYARLTDFDNETLFPDIPFNAPQHKYGAQLRATDFIRKGGFLGITTRHVRGFEYWSGFWRGNVAPYTVTDMTLGYQPSRGHMSLKLSATNLFNHAQPQLIGLPAQERQWIFSVRKRFP